MNKNELQTLYNLPFAANEGQAGCTKTYTYTVW